MIALKEYFEEPETPVKTVDLITTDRDLEDVILSMYPEPLLLEQIDKRKIGGTTFYVFRDLKESAILDFLDTYAGRDIGAKVAKDNIVYQH